MNKMILAIFGTVFLTVGLLSTAVAGEITGNGKWIAGSEDAPLNGKSACAYSGREDEPGEIGPLGEQLFKGLIAQSWGQVSEATREFFISVGAHPGNSCNPSKAEGGEP
jgi:hypothetical protein